MTNTRIETLRDWLKSDSNDPFVPYALGLELKNIGELDECISIFKKTIEKFPDYLPVYYQYGIILAEKGDKQNAKFVLNNGVLLAKKQNNLKTLAELNEIIQQHEID